MSENPLTLPERRSSRSRGVLVYPVPEEIGGPPIFGEYALMIRRDTDGVKMKMVHYEGVAYGVSDDRPWVWSDYITDLKPWSPQELLDATKDVQPVDLADWVADRNKDRLESNFSQCYWWATSAE